MSYSRKTIIAASLFLAFPVKAQVDVGNTFKDYTPISTPQTGVPVGALWLPGTGASGDGADPANLRIVKGADNSVVTRNLKQSVGLTVGTFLGLGADRAKNLKVDLGDIQIHRVRDLTALDAQVGQQVILAAIKAGTISLTGDEAITATLKAAAQAKGIPIAGEIGGGKTSTLRLNGSDLFLAFQVVEFRPAGGPKQKTYHHQGKGFTAERTYEFDFCRCGPGDAIKVYVRNLAAPMVGGKYETQTIESRDSAAVWTEVGLKRFLRGNELTTASAKIAYDSAMRCDDRIVTPDGKPFCLANYPKSNNYVRLTTTKTKIVPVKKPSGSF
jgi:hypothetical protein